MSQAPAVKKRQTPSRDHFMRPKASVIDLYRLSWKSQKAPLYSLGIPNEFEQVVVLKHRRLGYL